MRIHRIKTLKSGRVRLYAEGDDEPALELALDLFLQAGLGRGDELSADQVSGLRSEDERYRAREAALNLLAHRARSATELRRRLWRKEFPEPVIDRTLAWLEERGYVDDGAFAESFVRDRLRLRPRGRMGLLQELRKKGVAPQVAEAAVDAVMAHAEVDEAELARQAAGAWARKNASAVAAAQGDVGAWRKARRRLYGHLARRGFPPDAVRGAIDEVLRHD